MAKPPAPPVSQESVDKCLSLHQKPFKCAKGAARKINVREAVSKTQISKMAANATAPVSAPRPGKGKAGADITYEEFAEAIAADEEDADHNGEVDPQRKSRGKRTHRQPPSPRYVGMPVAARDEPSCVSFCRKKKREEEEYLKQRRELKDMTVCCKECRHRNYPYLWLIRSGI